MKTAAKWLVPMVLIVFIVAPGITGFWVESEIDNSAEQLSAILRQQDVQLLNSSFTRGWFGSDQTAEFGLTSPTLAAILTILAGPKAVDDIPTLLIETRATHGVLPVAKPSHGGLRPAIAQTRSQLYLKYPADRSVELPMEVYTSVGVGGWAKLLVQPISRQIVQGSQSTDIEWGGADFEGDSDYRTSGTLRGKVGQLQIATSGGKLRLAPSTLTGNFSRHQYKYLDSQFELHVPAVAFDVQQGDPMGIEDLQASSTLVTLDNRATGAHRMQTGQLTLPGLMLDSTNVAFEFDFDAQAFSDFYMLARNIVHRPDTPTEKPTAIESAFVDMVRKGGTLKIEKFELSIEGSLLQVEMDLKIPSGQQDIASALKNSNGTGSIVLPQNAVNILSRHSQQIAFMIQMGAGAGFIQKTGQAYTADIKYEDGLLLLNGLPLQLPF
ncbi:MAG: DUF945 family protein [Gammaproteobacteria bacterium]|nr:DUF945 family protein [Gammaproteobacteria bacterium]